MEQWLRSSGISITSPRLYAADSLPNHADYDLLIIMGGPMSVHDEAEFPWLQSEKTFIREAIEQGKRVLGICLGAQLIAHVLGAKIYPNAEKEIGWFPVAGTTPHQQGVFSFLESIDVFHWHGETFTLPEGAVQLARSVACENQGFQYGSSVIGLQFHLETTSDSAHKLVDHCRQELVPAPYVQDEATILHAPESRYQAINGLMADLLTFLIR